MSTDSFLPTYYDHDGIWLQRRQNQDPFWGPYSRRLYDQLSLKIAALPVPAGTAVADVGCGAGAFGLWLERLGFRYHGYDASDAGIAWGKELFPHLTLACLDLVRQPFPIERNGFYSLVTAINSLHCLTDTAERAPFLRHIRECVREGGWLILTTMCGPVEPDFKASKRPRIYLEPEEILAEIKEAGFAEIVSSELVGAHDRARIPNLTVIARCAPGQPPIESGR
jgi:SAM-dependent methyltransferase